MRGNQRARILDPVANTALTCKLNTEDKFHFGPEAPNKFVRWAKKKI